MTRLLEWLLDLDHIRLGRDEPLSLQWQMPVEPWVLAGIGALAALVVLLSYAKESGSRWRRIPLAGIRVALLALVLAVLCRPTLVLQHNRVERSYVAILLDESRSMARAETYADAALAESVATGAGLADAALLSEHSRLELVRRAFLAREAAPLRELLKTNAVQLYTFAGALRRVASPVGHSVGGGRSSPTRGDATAVVALLDELIEGIDSAQADGAATDLAGALREVIEDARGRRLAAIVVAGDGRSTTSTDITELTGRPTRGSDATPVLSVAKGRVRMIPIYAIRIGSPAPVRDIRVGPLRAEESVFVNDILAVEAQIDAVGLTEPTQVTVRLVDERSGLSVATRTLILEPRAALPGWGQPGSDASGSVELLTKPTRAGTVRYRVEVSPLADELTTDNNVDKVEVTVVDDKLHVLYVDGYPRYEYRYLKNALVREPSMKISVLLLEADERFVQEGTEPIRRFPESPEELSRYDVVLFGDVDPRAQWLSIAQMRMLLDFVGNDGGGFGLIAGERYAPHRFRGTPLRRLLPIRIDDGHSPGSSGRYASTTGTVGTVADGFNPRLTPDGMTSRLLRFANDDLVATDPRVGRGVASAPRGGREASRRVFDALPQLYWFARTLGQKPGATVLLEHPTVRVPARRDPMPLVVIGRYGAGKLFFQATDDTWRWRRHDGEFLHDTYWVRVARELMGPRTMGTVGRDKRLVIRTDRRNYVYGQRVQTQVEVVDSELLAEQGDAMNVVLTDRQDAPVLRFSVARLVASDPSVGRTAGKFEGSCVPPRTGSFTLTVEDVGPRLGDKPAAARIHVAATDPESRRVEADHRILEQIATATGGRLVDLEKLEEAFAAIPDRSVQIPDDIRETLWDSKLVLLVFSSLISVEWALRKAFGML